MQNFDFQSERLEPSLKDFLVAGICRNLLIGCLGVLASDPPDDNSEYGLQ